MDNIFDSFFETADKNFEFVAAGLCAGIAKNIENLMKQQKISNVDLADRLECSKSYVTKLLRGDENLSVKTLAKIAIALDAEVNAILIPKSTYAELNRQLKEYFLHQQRQRREQEKKAWIHIAKSCNDENFGSRKISTFIWETNNALPSIA